MEGLIGKRASWRRSCLRFYNWSKVQLQFQREELAGSSLKERDRDRPKYSPALGGWPGPPERGRKLSRILTWIWSGCELGFLHLLLATLLPLMESSSSPSLAIDLKSTHGLLPSPAGEREKRTWAQCVWGRPGYSHKKKRLEQWRKKKREPKKRIGFASSFCSSLSHGSSQNHKQL